MNQSSFYAVQFAPAFDVSALIAASEESRARASASFAGESRSEGPARAIPAPAFAPLEETQGEGWDEDPERWDGLS